MTLINYTSSLNFGKRFKVAIHLIKLTLPIWDKYADENALIYDDTQFSVTETINRNILSYTIDTVELFIKQEKINVQNNLTNELKEIHKQFLKILSAIRYEDLNFPSQIIKIVYSVFNLLDASLGNEKTAFNEPTIYASINQAIDVLHACSILNLDEINDLLYKLEKEL